MDNRFGGRGSLVGEIKKKINSNQDYGKMGPTNHLNEAGEEDTLPRINNLQEEEMWLDEISERLGFH